MLAIYRYQYQDLRKGNFSWRRSALLVLFYSYSLWILQFGFFQFFCVFCHGQRIDHVLDVSTEESIQIVSSVSDTVVGYASLWEVVCADFRTAVARRYEALAA